MNIPNLQTINKADVEMNQMVLINNCVLTEEETTGTMIPDLDLDKNELSVMLLTTSENNSDTSSLCSSNEQGPGDLTPENVDTSPVLPAFDKIVCDNDLETDSNLLASDENFQTDGPITSFGQICDKDLEIDANLHETDEYYFCKAMISSQVPNFKMLQNDTVTHETTSTRRSGFEDRNVIDLLKDIKNDLISRSDNDDYGLAQLFEESHLGAKLCVKSKSARKRKKQQLKHRKLLTSQKPEKSRRQFAQSFQELQCSQIVFDDHDIDTSITCPVCLEMYHMPSMCNPCSHMFCDPCLRRLTGQGSEGIPCPLCRTVISSCELNKDFDEYLLLEHPNIYTARAMSERHTKFRHYQLPYTAPLPLGKRLMRQLIASRNSQSDTRWMSHDWLSPAFLKKIGGYRNGLRPSVRPSVRLSVRPSVLPSSISCPGHNSVIHHGILK